MFFKPKNRNTSHGPSPSLSENLDHINSTLRRLFDPEQIRTSQDPEENFPFPISTSEEMKATNVIQMDSEADFSGLSAKATSDEFEQLKAQRTQERIQRQHFLLTLPTTKDSESDRISLSSNKESKAKLSIKQSSQDTQSSQEDKKHI